MDATRYGRETGVGAAVGSSAANAKDALRNSFSGREAVEAVPAAEPAAETSAA